MFTLPHGDFVSYTDLRNPWTVLPYVVESMMLRRRLESVQISLTSFQIIYPPHPPRPLLFKIMIHWCTAWNALPTSLSTGVPYNQEGKEDTFKILYSTPEHLKGFLAAMSGVSMGPARVCDVREQPRHA